MRQFLIIGKDRATGKDVLLSGREDEPMDQLAQFKELARNPVHEDISDAILLQVVPFKKNLYFVTAEEAEANAEAAKEAAALEAKRLQDAQEAAKKAEGDTEHEAAPSGSGAKPPPRKKRK